MIIFKLTEGLSSYVSEQREKGKKLGFVPTMGALHSGHLTLIREALRNNDIVVCSIFVNPTQFNNPEDFRHYPITIEKDIEQLVASGCQVLFLPSVSEIYPPGYQKKEYDLGAVEFILEGKYRPGHFQGVCQVVDRLLDIVQPNRLYLGQKDYQQCMVIRQLIRLKGKEEAIQLRIVPTEREKDGLAMSSRNLRLTPEQRAKAPAIFRALSGIKGSLATHSVADLEKSARSSLEKEGFAVDYITVANAADLGPANDQKLVALAAASLGSIRLIDNLLLN